MSRHLGITTNQNDIHEEIKSGLHSGNACYHSVQNLLSSYLLSKNLDIKMYKTIILPAVLYGRESWSLTLWEEHVPRVSGNRAPRRIRGRKWQEAAEDCIMRSFITCTFHQILLEGHVARMGEMRNAYILIAKPEWKRPLGRFRRR
jgi:hypothetical protein